MCILAAIHSTSITFVRKLVKFRQRKWILVVSLQFAIGYIVGSVRTFTQLPDVLTRIRALLFAVTIAREDASKMRSVMLLSMTPWVIFDILVGAYSGIFPHGSTIASILAAKHRLDKKSEI